MKNRLKMAIAAIGLAVGLGVVAPVVAPVDTPVVGAVAAEAHSGGCNPYVQNYPYYVLRILKVGSIMNIYWVNVSTGSIHIHRCEYFFG